MHVTSSDAPSSAQESECQLWNHDTSSPGLHALVEPVTMPARSAQPVPM